MSFFPEKIPSKLPPQYGICQNIDCPVPILYRTFNALRRDVIRIKIRVWFMMSFDAKNHFCLILLFYAVGKFMLKHKWKTVYESPISKSLDHRFVAYSRP